MGGYVDVDYLGESNMDTAVFATDWLVGMALPQTRNDEREVVATSACMRGDDCGDCCGCGACANICPKNCIKMIPDDEGFLYPEIDELLAEFHRQDFTTFLVSNGMYWEKLGSLENEPTQLYVSLDAPNEKVYKELCNPQINDAWSNLNKTLELMNSFDSRTAIRITSVKGKNMINTDEYAKLINKANPKFVEVKAYMFVGSSRKRLSLDNMPSHQEVRDFAQEIADKTGRELTKESEVSRVVLLE